MKYAYTILFFFFFFGSSMAQKEVAIELNVLPSIFNHNNYICNCARWDEQVPVNQFVLFTDFNLQFFFLDNWALQTGFQFHNRRFENEDYIVNVSSVGSALDPNFSIVIKQSFFELPFAIVYRNTFHERWHLKFVLGTTFRVNDRKTTFLYDKIYDLTTDYINSDTFLASRWSPQFSVKLDYDLTKQIGLVLTSLVKLNTWGDAKNNLLGLGIGLRYRIVKPS